MSDTTAQFKFIPEACGHVLQDRRLAVPVYQRSYSWTDEQIAEYWDDIRSAFARSGAEYFLGTIVLSLEGSINAHTIIDGQQRLATTSILLAAIRNEFNRRGDTARANIVQNTFLSTLDLSSGGSITKLRLNSDDNPYYWQVIVKGEDPVKVKALTRSHQLIAGALKQFDGYISSTASDVGSEWIQRLLAWVEFLSNRLRVIVVEVPTEADAFLIFETLNDRGADLTIADLLKNFLFGKSGTSLDTVRNGWMAALGALDMSAENSLFTTFLRHFWSSRYGATRERLLFKSIKENVTSETQAVAFSQELWEAARHYAALLNSEHEYWSDLGTTSKDNVDTLARLGLEQNRPLLLSAMQHFSKRELARTLRALVSWSVRGLVVGGIGAGKTERYYSQAAVKIRKGEIKSSWDLLQELSDIIPTDEEFRAAFASARVTNAKLARYFLLVLERTKSGKKEPELVPNADEEQLNLEHVLPKSAKERDWPQFSDEERTVWVHRLGNMALLQKGPNGRIGNKAWSKKMPVLARSELDITKTAALHPDWTKEVIQQRQDELAVLALTAWPRKS